MYGVVGTYRLFQNSLTRETGHQFTDLKPLTVGECRRLIGFSAQGPAFRRLISFLRLRHRISFFADAMNGLRLATSFAGDPGT